MSDKNENDVLRDELPMPKGVELSPDGVCTVFVGKDENEKTQVTGPTATEDILRTIMSNGNGYNDSLAKTLNSDKHATSKSFENSNQSPEEIGSTGLDTNFFDDRIVDPPYDPDCFAKFLELSEVHERCVKVKVRDSVGRSYRIKAKYPIKTDNTSKADSHGMTISEKQFQNDCIKILQFIENCNSIEEFAEICYKVGMDKEAIGWGAFEVIRNGSGKIARLQHIPATRLKVLKNFEGFVEERTDVVSAMSKQYNYYQPFGQKVGKYIDDPMDLSSRPKKKFKPYNPEEDGELEIGVDGLTFNLVDKNTGEKLKGRVQTNFKKAANEVLFIPNTHSNTIYYGYSDIVSAIGAIITNVHIRDYLLQFFEHNCIPRHAVIIKGAKVDDKFMELITDYFENKVKGSAHKTIILALTGFGNKNVEVEFRALTTGNKEADFLNTRKANDGQIMAAHGIPPAVLGINDSASLGSGKGLSQGDLYKNRVILPLQLFWANKLNKLFKLGLGCKYAKIEFDPMDLRDALTVAQTLNLLMVQGILTINEARRQLGIEGNITGGDTAFIKTAPTGVLKVEDIPVLESMLEQQEEAGVGQTINFDSELNNNQDQNREDSIVAGQMN